MPKHALLLLKNCKNRPANPPPLKKFWLRHWLRVMFNRFGCFRNVAKVSEKNYIKHLAILSKCSMTICFFLYALTEAATVVST